MVKLAVSLVATALIGATSGVVYALLTDGSSLGVAVIGSGELDLRITGPINWTTTNNGTVVASGSGMTSLQQSTLQAGDVVTICVPIETYLKGDNLAAELGLSYRDPAASGEGAQVTFSITDSQGAVVAPSGGGPVGSIGTSLAVPGLLGSDAGSTQTWQVVIELTAGNAVAWTQSIDDPVGSTAVGEMKIDLVQVRDPVSWGGGS